MITKFKKPVAASGTTVENEPIIKSDGASSNVMQWLSNDESSNITISEDGSNNLDLVVSAGNVGIGTSTIPASTALMVQGYVAGASNQTADTSKYFYLVGVPYTITEENSSIIGIDNIDGVNRVVIGGGSGNFNAATDIKFYTAANNTTTTGTERLAIDSTGIITTGRAAGGVIQHTNDTSNITISGGTATNVGGNIGLFGSSHATTPNRIQFRTSGTAQLAIDSTGLASFSSGIAFSSQTDTSATGAAATSTTLDHYEEGTFTLVEPTVGTAITGGVGKYTRIGDRVFITVQFTLGTVTNGSHFKVAGLPFPVPDDDDSKGLVLNYSNKTDVEYAVTTKNSSEVEFRTDTGGYSTCTNASGGTFNLQGHYKV